VTDDVVLGREPGQAPEVSSGRARPVVLRDREQSTSRVHAEIRLSGWRVAVVDRGSANGTYVSRSGSAGPWVLVPSDPGVPLAPGDRLRLGRREVLFDRYQLS
jgi:pSer/pThr/pTyr-binding forkhead associated (FHA) protein